MGAFKNLCKDLETTLCFASSGFPKVNDWVERVNREK